jgi:hypothetical protein
LVDNHRFGRDLGIVQIGYGFGCMGLKKLV